LSVRAWLLVIFMTPSLAAAPATAPARQPASRPTASGPLFRKALTALDNNGLAALSEDMNEAATLLLDVSGTADSSALVEHAAIREFARAFGRLGSLTTEQTDTLRWLLQHPPLATQLLLAMTDQDAPDRVLAVLAALRQAEPRRVDRLVDLTVAVCVVWDESPSDTGGEDAPVDPGRAAEVFGLYASPGTRLRYDLTRLPWQFLVFVVDNPASPEEVDWARAEYARQTDLARAFTDPPYAHSGLRPGPPPEGDRPTYTLMNLRQRGGICPDQAYFAAVIAKSLGVPAAVALPPSPPAAPEDGVTGDPQAWACLFQPGGRATWDSESARYAEHDGLLGIVTDPQTGEQIDQGELEITASLATARPADRDVSLALCKLISAAPPQAALELLQAAMRLSPGNRRPWHILADLVAEGRLPPGDVAKAERMVITQLMARSPSFAAAIAREMLVRRDETEQLAALESLANATRGTPAVHVSLQLAQADLMLERGEVEQARELIQGLLNEPQQLGPSAFAAAQRAERLAALVDDQDPLLGLYDELFAAMPRPRPCPHAGSTAYAAIGYRYADLLDQAGRLSDASSVRARVNGLITRSPRR
jgi:hypothetical protein